MTSFQRFIVGKKFKEIQIPTESIYNLIPSSREKQEIAPRYQSKYSSATKKFYESGKKTHQTMGFAKTPLKNPDEFLRKQTRDADKSIGYLKYYKFKRKPFKCLDEANKRPPVPRRGEAPPILHETPSKDFVRVNVLSILKTPASKPTPRAADTRRGDAFVLEYSGLVPKFCRKEDFGKTPRYLVRRRQDLEYSSEMFEKSTAEEKFRILSDEEKTKLLEGLAANLKELNRRYLCLPLMIDTKVLQNRKLDLEKKIRTLEKDIEFLETNKNIDIFILPD